MIEQTQWKDSTARSFVTSFTFTAVRAWHVRYGAKHSSSIEATSEMEYVNVIQPSEGSAVRDYVCWSPGQLAREVPGAGVMIGDENQRAPPCLSYHVTGVGLILVIMLGDEKQRLPLRISYHACANLPQRGSEAENITFRRLYNGEKEKQTRRRSEFDFRFSPTECSCPQISTQC